jgi:hypothetical protein
MVFHLERGDVLDGYLHPNQAKYSGQRIMVIPAQNYAYLLPYVENDEELFLKTIIPSRKVTEKYLGKHYENKAVKRRKRNPE